MKSYVTNIKISDQANMRIATVSNSGLFSHAIVISVDTRMGRFSRFEIDKGMTTCKSAVSSIKIAHNKITKEYEIKAKRLTKALALRWILTKDLPDIMPYC